MKRYQFSTAAIPAYEYCETTDGEWVRFEDAQAVITELRAQTVQLRERIEEAASEIHKQDLELAELRRQMGLAAQTFAYQTHKIESLQGQIADRNRCDFGGNYGRCDLESGHHGRHRIVSR